MSVLVFATLDTKGVEAAFVRDALVSLGASARLVDTGCLGPPTVPPDISRDTIYEAAGESLAELQARADRGMAVSAAAVGAARLARRLYERGEVAGILGLGGSAGTTIATTAMRALPVGVPKLMVSTLASGQVRPWVGDKDILMLNAVVDILGINRISREVLSSAARAMAGLVLFRPAPGVRVPGSASDRPLVAATMFGVTTPCVSRAREVLEAVGYEVVVFHATGNGGQAMESLISDGMFAGVLDLTTTELADELVGGILSAGPDRLTAAARRGTPQVISVGALDMVNFGPPETVPEVLRERRFYRHNPTVTLMRTTVQECALLGAEIGRKAAQSTGPVAICLPRQGVSAIDCAGGPFEDALAREALFESIRAHSGPVEIREFDCHINDPEFAESAAQALLQLMNR